MYSIAVRSSDGHLVTVTWQIDTHRKECRPYVLRVVSQQLRVDTPEQALEILATWTRDQLLAHLGQFPRERLLPPSMR